MPDGASSAPPPDRRRCALTARQGPIQRSRWRHGVVLPLLAAFAGCAGVVAPATRTAFDTGIATANTASYRRELESLLSSPEVAGATQHLTRAVLDEVVSGRDASELDAHVARLATEFARDLGPLLATTVNDEVLPRLQAEIAKAVQTAVTQVLDERNRAPAANFAASVADRTITVIRPQAAAIVSDGISGALRVVLTRDLSPAFGRLLDDNAQAISRMARSGTAGALLGVADAMDGPFGAMWRKERAATVAEVQRVAEAERKVWFGEIEKEIQETRLWFQALLLVAAIGALLVFAALIMLWSVLRSQRRS